MTKKQKNAPSVKNIANALVSVFATAFIVLGTLLVIYYARGYRINRDLTDFERTGVLNIESDPLRATIILEGEVIGRTPKTLTSLKEGEYEVQLIRDNYIPWKTTVEIIGEKSTPVYPTLFLAENEAETVFKIDNALKDITKPRDSNYIFILTQKEIEQNVALTNAETGEPNDPRGFTSILYKIWRYETTPGIWGNQQNPKLVFEMDIPFATDLNLIMSDNGEHAVAIVKTIQDEGTNFTTYYLDTSQVNNPKPIDLSGFVDNYDINWSQDNEYLVLESDNEIVSFNISSNTKYLLKKKSAELVWSTDPEGNFNYLNFTESPMEGEKGYMQIMQTALTGSRSEVLVDKIYYGEDNKLLITQEELDEVVGSYIFTNSPSSTQFAGEIVEFNVMPHLDIVSIVTEYAMYLYDLTTGKYTLVAVTPGEFYQASPSHKKILYHVASGMYAYTFDKESADHTTELGSKKLFSNFEGDEHDLKWRNNSKIIYYYQQDRLNYVDANGENKNNLVTFDVPFFSTDSSGDYVFGVQEDENGWNELVRVRVR